MSEARGRPANTRSRCSEGTDHKSVRMPRPLTPVGCCRRAGKKHTVTHDERTGATSVTHLESVACADAAAVAALLQRAGRLRSVGATAANERSSRSHMVFLLSIRANNPSTGQHLNGAPPTAPMHFTHALRRVCVPGLVHTALGASTGQNLNDAGPTSSMHLTHALRRVCIPWCTLVIGAHCTGRQHFADLWQELITSECSRLQA